MRFFDTERDASETVRAALTERPVAETEHAETVARAILADVKTRGDEAVADYTRRFDWPGATATNLAVPEDEMREAQFSVDKDLGRAISRAAKNIKDYHNAERGHLQTWSHLGLEGRSLGQILQPVQRVGIYVPGGHAAYPSTVLMAAIPAVMAGVPEIYVCSPPHADGHVATLVAAVAADQNLSGVFRVGGAQAIGALAYGTETIPKVDVIAGPGNAYVNAAKRLVYGEVGIDMLAGPSEIAIIADEDANPVFGAADLLAQTEHGSDNRGVLFSPSQRYLDAAQAELARQRAELSRQEILQATEKHLILVKTRDLAEAITLSNVYAPEHLELHVRDPLALLPQIKNAGGVLLGEYTSAPIGDYYAGPSHTLPTAGAARFSSPLSVATFLKRTSILYYSREAAREAADDVSRFALAEGFDGHAAAARLRRS